MLARALSAATDTRTVELFMTRVILASVAFQAALAIAAWAADLSGFVGKTVQDKVGGYQLFNAPNVKKNFVGAFGSTRYAKILDHMQGDGIKTVTDPELGQLLVTGQCQHHDCPNQSVLIMQMNGAMVGLCLGNLSSESPDIAVVEWSGVGWSVKRTAQNLNCRSDTPDAELADFKAARARTR
jgi:hypothetical protein